MAVKKNSYITEDLLFAEVQLSTWRKYMEDNPIDTLEDRWGKKEMPKGGYAWVVTASREQQIKCVQDTLAKYLSMLEVVDKLRSADEAKKKTARGGHQIPESMEIENE